MILYPKIGLKSRFLNDACKLGLGERAFLPMVVLEGDGVSAHPINVIKTLESI